MQGRRSYCQRFANLMTAPSAQTVQEFTASTRVIVSFGARDGGFDLTLQLRLDIMDRYGKRRVHRLPTGKFLRMESDESFCYLDAVSLEKAGGTTYTQMKVEKVVGGLKKDVGIDVFKMANPFWNKYYPQAMANAAVMIFQITQPWLASQYCLEEFAWFMIQGVNNLEVGKPVYCIFMVFEEAKDGFKLLLAQLRNGLATKAPSECMAGWAYERMCAAFKVLDPTYADVAAGRRLAMRSRFNMLIDLFTARTLDVPPGFDTLQYTDYHDANDARIDHLAKDLAPGQYAYANTFENKYGMTSTFQKVLFEMLDADLAKVGVVPVPSV
jgi:hypothetical protein